MLWTTLKLKMKSTRNIGSTRVAQTASASPTQPGICSASLAQPTRIAQTSSASLAQLEETQI